MLETRIVAPSEVQISNVRHVYSGKPGCACGCRGKHTYASAHRAAEAAANGYPIADQEISDRTVAIITGRVLKLGALLDPGAPYILYHQTETRLYIVYLAEPLNRTVALERVQVRRVCAWCQTVLDPGTPNADTTHTICPTCKMREMGPAFPQDPAGHFLMC